MEIENVKSAAHSQPFQPFTLRLSDGRAISVAHPDFVAFTPGLVIVGDSDDNVFHIDPFLIVSIDFTKRTKRR